MPCGTVPHVFGSGRMSPRPATAFFSRANKLCLFWRPFPRPSRDALARKYLRRWQPVAAHVGPWAARASGIEGNVKRQGGWRRGQTWRGSGRRANRYFLADGRGQGHASQSRFTTHFLSRDFAPVLPTPAAGVAAGPEETTVATERLEAYHVEPVPRSLMAAFVAAHHYAVRVPPHCLLSLGCFVGSDLVGVASWGYGVRPRHAPARAALVPRAGKPDASSPAKPGEAW